MSDSDNTDDDEFTVDDRGQANVDQATMDFLTETYNSRSLMMSPDPNGGTPQLTCNDFVQYLGIDLEIEPELAWIAREMLAAPMPPNARMLVSKSDIVYFHDLENGYYTLEHPLTQRYLKVLENSRLGALAFRTKPSVNGLINTQPDVLFHNQFRNLQIPCQDCNTFQSTVKCNQCVMSFCDKCFDNLHQKCDGPRKYHTKIPTAVGSLCSSCGVKKPQVYCGNCEDYFCFCCFEEMHKKGYRLEHHATLVSVSDGEIVEPGKKCEECEDNPAAFYCDQCMDNFCTRCYWTCHLNGNRRNHTVSKVIVNPLCNQCSKIRASVYCEQCQELLCTECFTELHFKGNRQLHMMSDAMNVLLLLEKLDPCFQEHMSRARPRVLSAITQLQGWKRGIEARQHFRKRRDLVTKIQRRWRGAMTRRKLVSMLDHYKWRKRQISDFFLPTSKVERQAYKKKFNAKIQSKDVTLKATQTKLDDLRRLIVDTAVANPLEDISRTSAQMSESHINEISSISMTSGMRKPPQKKLPIFTVAGSEPQSPQSMKASELTAKDIRQARDITLRQLLRIDDREMDTQRVGYDTAEKEDDDSEYGKKKKQKEKEPMNGVTPKLRHVLSYRDRQSGQED